MPNPKHSPRRRDTIRVEAARRQRSAQRRKVAESAAAAKVDELVRAAIELRDRMLDPATPLPDVVVLLLERYEGEPVPLGLDRMFTRRGASPERLAAVTEALLAADDDPASVTALSFAALVASGREEPAVCRHYLDQVLSRRPDEDEQLTLVNWLAYCGRRADALELLEPLLAADPAADAAVEVYGAVLEAVGDQAANRALTAQCTCGSGRSFGDCCRPRDAAACERFLDRRGLYALRDGLMAWLPASPYADPVDEHVADWLEVLRDQLPDLSEGLASALADLAIEHALVVALVTGEPDDPGPMRAFAADPTVPPELARRALDWSQHVHYGLWLVQDPTPGPGLWMTDIVTGIARYVAVAPEQVEGLVPWAVLLGAIIPVDGVWR
ncbi:MAG TPA: SEC-C metal-binding domain-containing protein, partial [Mycobacteriales bacterium]|nr:SEC-C metal-binding domain-containing protein [Mycobacteriales bacterium]